MIFIFISHIIYVLFKLSHSQNIDFNIWKRVKSTDFSNISIKPEQFYIQNQGCQLTTSSCLNSPSLPTGRDGHSVLTFTTYSQEEANRICQNENECGPYCREVNIKCNLTSGLTRFKDYPILNENEKLEGILNSNNTNCPPNCCSTNNEYCLRTYDVSGRFVTPSEELLIFFGGTTQINIEFEDFSDTNDCSKFDLLKEENLYPKEKLNSLFMINNCGLQIMNDIWIYQIAKDEWYYLKPHIDPIGKQKTQQIPQARMYHSAIYIEKMDFSMPVELRIIRKYMLIYGGYSIYCQNACDDFWQFEIAYAPQRYYPNLSKNDNWNRGNRWSQIYSASYSTPGKRLKHSMIIDKEMKFAYLFGGVKISEKSDGNTYELMNDLWSYEISSNKWLLMVSLGLSNLTKRILYWDGTVKEIQIEDMYLEDDDKYETSLKNYGDDVNFPMHRASTGMVYLKRNRDIIIIFGGYTNKTNSITNELYQEHLNDIWAYSIKDYTWRRAYPNSDEVPSKRFGMGLVATTNNTLLLYGGLNSEMTLDDLWLFNIDTNMWTEIKQNIKTEYTWPPQSFLPTFIIYSKGVLLYGGSYFLNINDFLYNSTEISRNSTLSQSSLRRKKVYNNYLWKIEFNNCDQDLCKRGTCNYGICKCNEGYFGTNCDNLLCPNSICYYDSDVLTSQQCFHCSGHGQCHDRVCVCEENWVGDDCSQMNCINNCNNFGECIPSMPIYQCNCNQTLRKGGDDCSITFCIDSCRNRGECNNNDGSCKCNENYYSDDCSIFFVRLNEKHIELKRLVIFLIVLLVL